MPLDEGQYRSHASFDSVTISSCLLSFFAESFAVLVVCSRKQAVIIQNLLSAAT